METINYQGKHYEAFTYEEFRQSVLNAGFSTKKDYLEFLHKQNPKHSNESLICLAEIAFPTDVDKKPDSQTL